MIEYKPTGTSGDMKPRFSLKMPDGTIRRFGTCNPKDDDNYIVVGRVLHHLDLERSFPRTTEFLPEGTMITSGYYDHEHGEWELI